MKKCRVNRICTNFGGFRSTSFTTRTEFRNMQTEFQSTEDNVCTAQNTEVQYSPQIEINFMAPQLYNASGFESFLQWQGHFEADHRNSLFEYNSSSGENIIKLPNKVQEDLHLLGLHSLNNDSLSQSFDSLFLDITPSDFNLLDSKDEVSISKKEALNNNKEITSESKCENVKSNNEPSGSVSNVESFKPLHIISDSFLRQKNFQGQVKISRFERIYVCDICFKKA
ncbi:hypothetical protein TNCV_4284561 [Trichonephila clavipes]|uniref:Uncharacterized protein n=1 Tax=Trichonephila clavipes TaxID=2585209 RepID=A0A8X6STQ4_TRICX|nr:hypothetical protein TNCV_4284561 [Trichonephila clavipes]